MFTILTLAILTLGILNGCTSRSGPPASVHYDKAVSPYHIVKKGESIASIARKYGMDKRELIRINGLESPYRIVKGQRLIVKPHKSKSKKAAATEMDDSEAPATEEVGTVPEDGDVHVQPLAPAAGMAVEGGRKGSGVLSEGASNPEIDDEGESEQTSQDDEHGSKHKYDEDTIDEAEGSKRHRSEQSTTSSTPPADRYIWPVDGTVIRPYNPKGKKGERNDGINIAAAKGTPVVAANNGVVAYAGNQLRGFGNVVLIKHDNGVMTVYAHLEKATVKKGAVVNAGDQVGTLGHSGTVSEDQLHFEVREGRKSASPLKYLPKR